MAENEGYAVLAIEGYGANIKRLKNDEERTVWAKLMGPNEAPVLVAIERYPGAGPQPEGTISLFEFEEMLVNIQRTVAGAIDTATKPEGEW